MGASRQLLVRTWGRGISAIWEKYVQTFGEVYSAGSQPWLREAGYQNLTNSSRFVPLAKKGFARVRSIRLITRVPTGLGPVGFGTAAVRVLAKADLTTELIEVVLVCRPIRLTCCGLAPPLSLIETAPVKVPRLLELKVTEIVQDFPAPTVEPQVLVCVKPLEPVIAILLMCNVAPPTFVKAILCGGGGHVLGSSWQEKDRLVGTSLTTLPVPLTLAVCGLPGALSFTDKIAVREPGRVGWKVTLIVQLAPAARDVPQVAVW